MGVAMGVALGVAMGVAMGVAPGVALGVATGVVTGVALGVATGVTMGVKCVVICAVFFNLGGGSGHFTITDQLKLLKKLLKNGHQVSKCNITQNIIVDMVSSFKF